jgi:hypothetical protein
MSANAGRCRKANSPEPAHGAGTAVYPQPASQASEPSIPDQISGLSELRSAGILTDDEFAAKKAELLARM